MYCDFDLPRSVSSRTASKSLTQLLFPTHLIAVSLDRRHMLAQPLMSSPALVQRTFSILLALGAVGHLLLQVGDLLREIGKPRIN